MKKISLIGWFIALTIVGSAHGMTTNAPGTSSPPPSSLKAPAPSPKTDNLPMISGTIESLDIPAGSFTLFQKAVRFDRKKVLVYTSNGQRSSLYELKKGTPIRYLNGKLDDGTAGAVVIYIVK